MRGAGSLYGNRVTGLRDIGEVMSHMSRRFDRRPYTTMFGQSGG